MDRTWRRDDPETTATGTALPPVPALRADTSMPLEVSGHQTAAETDRYFIDRGYRNVRH